MSFSLLPPPPHFLLLQECGLLEWVNDTSTLRSLIIESHTQLSDSRDFPLPDLQTFHVDFQNKQVESMRDIGALIQMYNSFVGSYRPCLHRWFLDKFQVRQRGLSLWTSQWTDPRSLSPSIQYSLLCFFVSFCVVVWCCVCSVFVCFDINDSISHI